MFPTGITTDVGCVNAKVSWSLSLMPRSRVGRSATIVDSTTKSLQACMNDQRSSQAVYRVGYSSDERKDQKLTWPHPYTGFFFSHVGRFPCSEGEMRCQPVFGNRCCSYETDCCSYETDGAGSTGAAHYAIAISTLLREFNHVGLLANRLSGTAGLPFI